MIEAIIMNIGEGLKTVRQEVDFIIVSERYTCPETGNMREKLAKFSLCAEKRQVFRIGGTTTKEPFNSRLKNL